MSSPSRIPSKRKRSSEEDESSESAHEDKTQEELPAVEVLSHAAQRKRRKELAAAGAGATDAVKPEVTSGSLSTRPATEALAKRQHSVWVGNLSFKTDPKALRNFFSSIGENCVTRVHMPMKLPQANDGLKGVPGVKNDNRGFAYVDFASNDLKVVALTMSEHELDGRKLLIKNGDDFTGRPATAATGTTTECSAKSITHSKTAQRILASQKHTASPTLFLGNLGFETTEQSIQDMIDAHTSHAAAKASDPAADDDTVSQSKSKAGIRKVRMGTFEDSGLCKGFAFIDFETIDQATAALTNPRNHSLDGRKLLVQYAGADAVRRGGGGGQGAARGRPRVQKRVYGDDDEPPTKKLRVDDGENGPESREQGSRKRRPGKSERLAAKVAQSGAVVGIQPSKATSRRPTSGAALAHAPRASVAIVPSAGKKVVF
ncbi:hypothetical protein BKA62DRAFT_391650 [Auriculariales sp. MPI-PUGE-AT-0066]|nr:hypothetical protein BKA62DRAFT_391650 [Auriculariales sp. MPI-PUGE-AT-0066]